MRTVAIIPCTNQKSNIAGPAREVWIGNHFQLTLAHAEMWYDEVLVMSYKYGFIGPDFYIEPYDVNIAYASAGDRLRWWIQLREQIMKLSQEDPPPDLVAMYTGKYEEERIIREFVRAGLRNVIKPWRGARIGERMQLIYDNIPPYDLEKLAAGEYLLPEDWGAPKPAYVPPKKEPEKPIVEDDAVEWED